MKIGLLADIHGDIVNLKQAIGVLEREKVDRFVLLGDVIYNTDHADETVAILRDCDATGVWGNHDLGLCVNLSDELRIAYSHDVIQFFSTLQARLEIDDILISHTLPDQDATDPVPYYLGPGPDDEEALAGCFGRYPHWLMMVGHFHRWFAASDTGRLDWNGERPLQLDRDRRYFFVINAVMDGWAALLDDEQDELRPLQIG